MDLLKCNLRKAETAVEAINYQVLIFRDISIGC